MENIELDKIVELWKENIDSNDFNTLYADIPFCSQICSYCKFRKNYMYSEKNVDNYLNLLEKEMEFYSPIFKSKYISSFFVGGGSPSVLNPIQMNKLKKMIVGLYNINTEENGARTIELNPADLTLEKIEAIFNDNFFNRVSMGIQSFSQNVLAKNKRMYVGIDQLNSIIETIKYYNKDININIDLMVGINGETESTIVESFNALNDSDINLITLYTNSNKEKDEAFVDMFEKAIKKIDASKYEMYAMDNDREVEVKNSHLFFRKDNIKAYDYIYSLGPMISNRIGFGPMAQSQIKKLNLLYARDDALDFFKSKFEYEYKIADESDEGVLNFFHRNNKWIS